MSTRNSNVTRVSQECTESGIRRGRGRRETVTTMVKVAGVSTSNIKAEELTTHWRGVRVPPKALRGGCDDSNPPQNSSSELAFY
jgi:hypothetical protein